jgi:hypothetical protein
MRIHYLGFQKSAIIAILLLVAAVANTQAQTTIAEIDFDGVETNLISGFDPLTGNLDGGPGDYFGVANISAWPQGFPPGLPFSIADDTVVSVSNPANPAFPTDLEGIYGGSADFNNDFFAISDTREWTGTTGATPLTASWTFDISSAGSDSMQLSIDLGQQSNGASFGGITAASFLIEYSIDGAAFKTAISVTPADAAAAGFQYRAMDIGTVPVAASAMQATGSTKNPVTKFSAETGLAVTNTFLDKTPSTGKNAGKLDTFVVDLNGSGNTIEIRITCFVDNEAMVFDNIKVFTNPSFVLGDANGDGNFDFGDIEPFFLAITDPTAFAQAFPNVDPDLVLDFDGDMVASFGDIEGFFAALTNP